MSTGTRSTKSAYSGSMFRVRSVSQVDSEREWDGDDIRATNCDYTGCQVNDNVMVDQNKVPIEYNCDHYLQLDSTAHDALGETQVSVDYEALIPITADQETNERQLQWRILLAAATGMGLDKCYLDEQQWGTRERQLQPVHDATTRSTSSITPTTPILYAIRSDLNASSTLDFPCSELESTATSQCIPVRSVLTLMYMGTQTQGQILQEKVMNLLQDTLTNRTEELYVSDVEGLRYVGTFDFVSANGNSTPVDSGTDTVVRVGTLISSVSAVLLVITILIFRWQKRDSKDNNEQPTQVQRKMDVDLHSLESGRMASTMPTNSSSDSNLGNNSTVDLAQGPSSESTIPEPNSADLDDEDHKLTYLADTTYFASRSSDSGDRVAAKSLEAPLPLPPRPPRRGESVQLKVARKPRKKKKKRPTLIRVNSREHVNSMEAIPETITDESLLESGSEYSTDDDGSSNFSSSTNTSPVRSHSLPGSRSSSPSPLDFSNDFASNVNFIIDCGDLAFPSDSNDDSISDRPLALRLTPVSPVKEEQTTRPIPPPWF